MFMDAEYASVVSEVDITKALDLLNSRLSQASIDGELDKLPPIYAHRAIWHLKLKMVRKAVKDLESAVKIDPSMLEARMLLVRCYQELKRPEEETVHAKKLRDCLQDQACQLSPLALAEAIGVFSSDKKEKSLIENTPAVANGVPEAAPVAPAAPKTNGKAPSSNNGNAEPVKVAQPAKDAPKPVAAAKNGRTSQASGTKPAPAQGARTVSRSGNTIVEEVNEPSSSAPSPPAKPSKTVTPVAAEPARPSSTATQVLLAQDGEGVSAAGVMEMYECHSKVAKCIDQINRGEFAIAEGVLSGLIKQFPTNFDALVARGTARALKGELALSESDFTKAVKLRPEHADVWKRRAQARGALGNMTGAASDLGEALERLSPSDEEGYVETLFESAMLQHKLRNFRRANRELTTLIAKRPAHKQALSMLGLTSTAMGNIEDGIAHYKRALDLDPNFKEAWINIFQSYKESGQTRSAEEAFCKIIALDTPQNRSLHSYRMMGHMRQCMGQHYSAVDILTKALTGMTGNFQKMELMFLRGACYHAMGRLKEAYADYERCLNEKIDMKTTPQDTKGFQALAYYQRELTLYLHRVQDSHVSSFCIDKDLDPMFKEHWSKQVLPSIELHSRCPPSLPMKAPFPEQPRPLPTPPDLPTLNRLLLSADHIGSMLQYSHQGFLSNQRQQRAAGFAAIELAQKVLEDAKQRARGSCMWVDSMGASGGPGGTGRHEFSWRDAMDIIVRWRQLAEPNDQVLWVDLLTKEEFTKGFGSHTPMYSGQTKCVRYFMNFDRASALHKAIILKQGFAYDGQNVVVKVKDEAKFKAGKTAQEVWDVIGTDSWVVVPIQSKYRPPVEMEGTRLTLTRFPPSHQPDAHEFSIRTPVTPARWKDFDEELSLAWNAIMEAHIAGDAKKAADGILIFVYFWYNFMPLARGSAAVGYTTILSLFWAFGMPITANIPLNYQTDWEAMLTQNPDDFVAEISTWMYPPAALGGDERNFNAEKAAKYGNLEELPSALETLSTIRKRFYALNFGTPAQKKK